MLWTAIGGAATGLFGGVIQDLTKGWLDKSKFKSDIRFKSGDVRDSELMRQVIQGFDVVYHLAALISIPYSYVAPRSFFLDGFEDALQFFEPS